MTRDITKSALYTLAECGIKAIAPQVGACEEIAKFTINLTKLLVGRGVDRVYDDLSNRSITTYRKLPQ